MWNAVERHAAEYTCRKRTSHSEAGSHQGDQELLGQTDGLDWGEVGWVIEIWNTRRKSLLIPPAKLRNHHSLRAVLEMELTLLTEATIWTTACCSLGANLNNGNDRPASEQQQKLN